jgi:hypothetical protein
VIQKHPKLVTFKSQAYRIRCVYKTGVQTIEHGFNVSMLTTAGTIANTGPPPTCSMRICNSNGEDISRAEVGDSLMLKVTIKYCSTVLQSRIFKIILYSKTIPNKNCQFFEVV